MMTRLLVLVSCLISLHCTAAASGAHSSRALEALQRTTSLKHIPLNDGSELRYLDDAEQAPLGVLLPDQTGEHTGVALILPDSRMGPLNQQLLEPLRHHLAQAGWDTLTLDMPVHDAPALPERTLPVLKLLKKKQPDEGADEEASDAEATDEQASADTEPAAQEDTQTSTQDDSEDTTTNEEEAEQGTQAELKPIKLRPREPFTPLPEPASYADQLAPLLDTALAELRSLRTQPDEVNLVIGFGASAADAAHVALIFQERLGVITKEIKNLGVVIIEPEAESPSGRKLAEQIAKLRAPTLDLYFAEPGQQSLEAPYVKRRNLARRSGHKAYYSTRVRSWHGNWQERSRWLIRTLKGQLERHVMSQQTVPERVQESQQAFETAPGARL